MLNWIDYEYKMYLALQKLICHKNQPTNQPTNIHKDSFDLK